MPTRLRLSRRPLLIIVSVRPHFYSAAPPGLPPAESGVCVRVGLAYACVWVVVVLLAVRMHSVITAVFTRICPCRLFTLRKAMPFIKAINLHVVFFLTKLYSLQWRTCNSDHSRLAYFVILRLPVFIWAQCNRQYTARNRHGNYREIVTGAKPRK